MNIRFPKELPITARVADLKAAIEAHQVVIVAGATGSGKTTQLPKVALELGRGDARRIGITQPRRIAATSVAARVAEELKVRLGEEVGYQIRFQEQSSPTTRLKFMTDGILLAELQGDRHLNAYDTLIVDEAHERSLNIDFLLGWLKTLLPTRPDLKLIISSATIETERFSEFFGGAPVVHVEGRTYPVEVLYEPPDPDLDLPEAVAQAVENITSLDPQGDILVFLPGEGEIRECERSLTARRLRHTVIQPLYSRLSSAEQAKVFARVSGRRVILATNVAETSLTLPGIVYVVDTGLARLSRYDPRSGTTRLQIEGISQASADQRKGRCGRVREGICIRLYEQDSFGSRPAYTDPEVKRVGLAGVILRMKALGLGTVEDFPFIDVPASRAVAEGYRVLEELGALDEERQLTQLGRKLAHLPVDPRIGRMLLAAKDLDCVEDVLVLAAALSIQDPRERPRGQEQKADRCHDRFRDESSDFVGILKLWQFVQSARDKSTSQLKRACNDNFLSFVRVREWFEHHRQLEHLVAEVDSLGARGRRRRPEARDPGDDQAGSGQVVVRNSRADGATKDEAAPSDGGDRRAALHKALLSGLLSRIGQYAPTTRNYTGARQTRFTIHPGSALAKKPPAWVMALELVETTQLFARTVAKLEPEWLIEVAGHLLKRSYSTPHWSEKSARASVREHSTLFGLSVLKDRSVDYAQLSPVRARLMFIEHALVRGEYQSRGQFQAHNRELLVEVARLRDKARQSDMLADDESLLAFFDQRISPGITNGKQFETWRERAEKANGALLHLSLEDVLSHTPGLVPSDYPDTLVLHGVSLALRYKFDPAAEDDGITLVLPIALLPQLDPDTLDWTIPAWHTHKIEATLETLPRALRRELSSKADLGQLLSAKLRAFSEPFLPALVRHVRELTGVQLPEGSLRGDLIPNYLRLSFAVQNERGERIGAGRHLAELKERLVPQVREVLRAQSAAPHLERTQLKAWTFGDLPEFVIREVLGTKLRLYPALLDRHDSVELKLLESTEQASGESREGVCRLLLLALKPVLQANDRRLPPPWPAPGATSRLPPSRGEVDRFKDLVWRRTAREAFGLDLAPLPRNAGEFSALLKSGTPHFDKALARLSAVVKSIGEELSRLYGALQASEKQPSATAAARDLRGWAQDLAPLDRLEHLPLPRLEQLPRYLRGAHVRLGRAVLDPRKDAEKLAPLVPLWQEFQALKSGLRSSEAGVALRWSFEELRISVFAPELKPKESVSVGSVTLALKSLR